MDDLTEREEGEGQKERMKEGQAGGEPPGDGWHDKRDERKAPRAWYWPLVIVVVATPVGQSARLGQGFFAGWLAGWLVLDAVLGRQDSRLLAGDASRDGRGFQHFGCWCRLFLVEGGRGQDGDGDGKPRWCGKKRQDDKCALVSYFFASDKCRVESFGPGA